MRKKLKGTQSKPQSYPRARMRSEADALCFQTLRAPLNSSHPAHNRCEFRVSPSLPMWPLWLQTWPGERTPRELDAAHNWLSYKTSTLELASITSRFDKARHLHEARKFGHNVGLSRGTAKSRMTFLCQTARPHKMKNLFSRERMAALHPAHRTSALLVDTSVNTDQPAKEVQTVKHAWLTKW